MKFSLVSSSDLLELHCNVAPQILDPAQVWALGRSLHDSIFLCLEPYLRPFSFWGADEADDLIRHA